jgi:hypothetical protein
VLKSEYVLCKIHDHAGKYNSIEASIDSELRSLTMAVTIVPLCVEACVLITRFHALVKGTDFYRSDSISGAL